MALGVIHNTPLNVSLHSFAWPANIYIYFTTQPKLFAYGESYILQYKYNDKESS